MSHRYREATWGVGVYRRQVDRDRRQVVVGLLLDPRDIEPAEERQTLPSAGSAGPSPDLSWLSLISPSTTTGPSGGAAGTGGWSISIGTQPRLTSTALPPSVTSGVTTWNPATPSRVRERSSTSPERIEDAADPDRVVLDGGEVLPHRLEHHLEVFGGKGESGAEKWFAWRASSSLRSCHNPRLTKSPARITTNEVAMTQRGCGETRTWRG